MVIIAGIITSQEKNCTCKLNVSENMFVMIIN